MAWLKNPCRDGVAPSRATHELCSGKKREGRGFSRAARANNDASFLAVEGPGSLFLRFIIYEMTSRTSTKVLSLILNQPSARALMDGFPAPTRAAEVARRLASTLFSRRTCEIEKSSDRANFRQIQFRE